MAHKIDMAEAILAINPKAEVRIFEENYDTIQWGPGTSVIAKADIEAKPAELPTADDNKT